MPLSWLSSPRARWNAVARRGYRPLRGADLIFALLRLAALVGILGWYAFSQAPPELTNLIVIFAAYSLLFYLAFLFVAAPVAVLYMTVHIIDLLFMTLLVAKTGGIESNFVVGFYILVALNGLYFGWRSGTVTAVVTSVLYYLTDPAPLTTIHWTDFLLRCSPLFLLGLTMGFLSEYIEVDRRRIERLNATLQETLSNLKEAQLQLLEQERLTTLGQCAADIAHEIRNPLVAIGGFARRLMERGKGEPSATRYSRIIVNETARLERILSDLLLFTREKEPQMATLNLNSVINNLLSLSESVLNARNIVVDRRLETDLPPVMANRDHLKQVVLNLTTNAEQAMPEGGHLTVTTFTEGENDRTRVCFSVEDTGTGIDPAIINRILDPFFSTKVLGEGTGLGLSVCNKIVEDHGGTLEVTSVLGDGATFTVRLPAAEVTEPAPVAEPDAHAAAARPDNGD